MRIQYYFRKSPQGLCAWDVRRLVELSRSLKRERVPLSAIRELDEPYWCGGENQRLTCREIWPRAAHAGLRSFVRCHFVERCRVMDGMHRICKALLEGRLDVEAVRFVHDPEPDYVGVHADDLPYSDEATSQK